MLIGPILVGKNSEIYRFSYQPSVLFNMVPRISKSEDRKVKGKKKLALLLYNRFNISFLSRGHG